MRDGSGTFLMHRNKNKKQGTFLSKILDEYSATWCPSFHTHLYIIHIKIIIIFVVAQYKSFNGISTLVGRQYNISISILHGIFWRLCAALYFVEKEYVYCSILDMAIGRNKHRRKSHGLYLSIVNLKLWKSERERINKDEKKKKVRGL